MPQPPDVSFFTRYVIENPWPGGLLFLAVGAVLVMIGLRVGRWDRVRQGSVAAAVGALIFAIGFLVTSAGEHGQALAQRFVDAVVEGDLVAANASLADRARLHIGSPKNPGLSNERIREGLSEFVRRYEVESNLVLARRGYGTGAGSAEVHLRLSTDAGMGPVLTAWIIGAERTEEGEWVIVDLTWVALNGQTPAYPR